MFWADKIVDDIIATHPNKRNFIVRDEKTLSGSVHIGSLRGVVIHGIIAQILNGRGKKTRFLFEYNDFDPMDALASDLEARGFGKYMGMPLLNIPSPDGKSKNFAEQYGAEFLAVIKKIGFDPEIPRASDMYKQGKLDGWIKMALTDNNKIREIYKRVSGSEKPEHWSPVQVICEKCGKVGTTDVLTFDGSKVKYVCKMDKVTWAQGCGHEGEVSPFKGNAELTWKMEWPAKWDVYSVDIEGSGKDHNTAGGSHDIGEAICKEVAKTEVPFNIPYEFFLVGGKKMSSSKGIGQTASNIADLIPPTLLRFLMLRHTPNHPIEFDPEGDTIPRLFDHYDEAAGWYFYEGKKDTLQTDLGRLFELSQISGEKPVKSIVPRFSQLVFAIQIPRVNVYQAAEKLKGAPLNEYDKKELENRIFYAKKWLATYAPTHYRFTLQESLPASASVLSLIQREFLRNFAQKCEDMSEWDGEKVHSAMHELIKTTDHYNPALCFPAIYRIFLDKDSGPQAGWFLTSFEKDWVVARLREGADPKQTLEKKQSTANPPLVEKRLTDKKFRLSKEAATLFPNIQIAYALIEGVTVQKESEALERAKTEMTPSSDQAKTLLGELPILRAYQTIYRKTGVDPTKKKPTSIAMLDRIEKGQGLYKINTLIDPLNLLTLQHGISFGAFDMDRFAFPIVFDLAKGGEPFLPLGEDKEKTLESGELCMIDGNGLVMNRDYNYRDSDKTKITENTKNVFLTLDSLDPMPVEEAKLQLENAAGFIIEMCGGTLKEIYVA